MKYLSPGQRQLVVAYIYTLFPKRLSAGQVATGDEGYISQPPLQLVMAMGVGSGEWDVTKISICDFEEVTF